MKNSEIERFSQYLTFKLDEDLFSIDVGQVREVLDLTPITKIPGSPDFMCGIIDVRGKVLPVIDLKSKFGLDEIEKTLNTRIIVMDLTIDDEVVILGALADSVHEVRNIEPEEIEDPPKIGCRWKRELIKGIGKSDSGFIIILNMERVFSKNELAIADAFNPCTPDDENMKVAS